MHDTDTAEWTLRRADERGHADHGWLRTHHTFSFADYRDPAHMGFRSLRVINEDVVAPGTGFGLHGHRDMEIVTWVLAGALEHRDSLGNGSVIRPGEIQRMTAGTGIRHSEANPSESEPVHLLQIWLLPERRGLAPSYEQTRVADEELAAGWVLLAAPVGDGGVVGIHQDARLSATRLAAGDERELRVASGRHAWVQVARGAVGLDGVELVAGDGARRSTEGASRLVARDDAEVLWFDLA